MHRHHDLVSKYLPMDRIDEGQC